MSNGTSVRGRYIMLCDLLKELATSLNNEHRLGVLRFGRNLGPHLYPEEFQVNILELGSFYPLELTRLIAYSYFVRDALLKVMDLLENKIDTGESEWQRKILDAELRLRNAVAGVEFNAIDERPVNNGGHLVEALGVFDIPDNSLRVDQLVSESTNFHLLAFKLLGIDMPPMRTIDGYKLDMFLTKANYAKLCTIVCTRLSWVTADAWWNADNVRRTEYMDAAIEVTVNAATTADVGEGQCEAATPQRETQADSTLPEQTDPVTRAIALMLAADKECRSITIIDLPAIVGCSRSTLYRDPHFKATVQALKHKCQGNISKGRKKKDGTLEAGYDPADE